jgi:hypothetical protein
VICAVADTSILFSSELRRQSLFEHSPDYPAPSGAGSIPCFSGNNGTGAGGCPVLHKRTNTPAGSLHAGDFRIFEDGVAPQIRHLSRDELPLSIVLLFNLSATVHGPLKRRSQEAQAARDGFKSQDEVAFMVYGESARRWTVFGGIEIATRAPRPPRWTQARKSISTRRFIRPREAAGIQHAVESTDHLADRQHTRFSRLQTQTGSHAAGRDPCASRNRCSRMAKSHPPGDARNDAEWTARPVPVIVPRRSRLGHAAGCHLELATDGALRPIEWTVLARQGYYRR